MKTFLNILFKTVFCVSYSFVLTILGITLVDISFEHLSNSPSSRMQTIFHLAMTIVVIRVYQKTYKYFLDDCEKK